MARLRIDLRSNLKDQIVSFLAQKGQEIVNEAYWSKAAKDQSGSLHDAYGYAVFYDGKLEKKGYAAGGQMSSEQHKGWAKHNISPDTGRGYLESFFESYKRQVSKKGFCLICVNAIYYAQILEDGAQGRPKRQISTRYRIISQVADEMRDLNKVFKGAVMSTISPVGSIGNTRN